MLNCKLWENGLGEPEGEWVKRVGAVVGRREDRSGGREDSFASLLPRSELCWHLSLQTLAFAKPGTIKCHVSDIGYWTRAHHTRLLSGQPSLPEPAFQQSLFCTLSRPHCLIVPSQVPRPELILRASARLG